LNEALAALLEEDPSLRLREDGETGRLILSGMGELHLEVALERLRAERGIKLRAGPPQVSFREGLLKAGKGRCDFDRAMNGERLRASLDLSLSPLPKGAGRRFGLGAGLRANAGYTEAFRRGVEAALSAGPAGGWPVEDWEALLLGYSLPSSRQDALVLEISSSLAAREALIQAGTQVLEPWMKVELTCPEDCLGQAAAVLGARGGRIESVDDVGGEKYLEAAAPLRLLFGLATELRSATKGRAAYQAKFLRYEVLRET
jgi:elongation factor G